MKPSTEELVNAYVSIVVEGMAILLFMCAVAVWAAIGGYAI